METGTEKKNPAALTQKYLPILALALAGCFLQPHPISPPYVLHVGEGIDPGIAESAAAILSDAAGVPGCVTVATGPEEPAANSVARIEVGTESCGNGVACTWGWKRSAKPLILLPPENPDADLLLAHEVVHWITRRGEAQHDDYGVFANSTATVSAEAAPATAEALRAACALGT